MAQPGGGGAGYAPAVAVPAPPPIGQPKGGEGSVPVPQEAGGAAAAPPASPAAAGAAAPPASAGPAEAAATGSSIGAGPSPLPPPVPGAGGVMAGALAGGAGTPASVVKLGGAGSTSAGSGAVNKVCGPGRHRTGDAEKLEKMIDKMNEIKTAIQDVGKNLQEGNLLQSKDLMQRERKEAEAANTALALQKATEKSRLRRAAEYAAGKAGAMYNALKNSSLAQKMLLGGAGIAALAGAGLMAQHAYEHRKRKYEALPGKQGWQCSVNPEDYEEADAELDFRLKHKIKIVENYQVQSLADKMTGNVGTVGLNLGTMANPVDIVGSNAFDPTKADLGLTNAAGEDSTKAKSLNLDSLKSMDPFNLSKVKGVIGLLEIPFPYAAMGERTRRGAGARSGTLGSGCAKRKDYLRPSHPVVLAEEPLVSASSPTRTGKKIFTAFAADAGSGTDTAGSGTDTAGAGTAGAAGAGTAGAGGAGTTGADVGSGTADDASTGAGTGDAPKDERSVQQKLDEECSTDGDIQSVKCKTLVGERLKEYKIVNNLKAFPFAKEIEELGNHYRRISQKLSQRIGEDELTPQELPEKEVPEEPPKPYENMACRLYFRGENLPERDGFKMQCPETTPKLNCEALCAGPECTETDVSHCCIPANQPGHCANEGGSSGTNAPLSSLFSLASIVDQEQAESRDVQDVPPPSTEGFEIHGRTCMPGKPLPGKTANQPKMLRPKVLGPDQLEPRNKLMTRCIHECAYDPECKGIDLLQPSYAVKVAVASFPEASGTYVFHPTPKAEVAKAEEGVASGGTAGAAAATGSTAAAEGGGGEGAAAASTAEGAGTVAGAGTTGAAPSTATSELEIGSERNVGLASAKKLNEQMHAIKEKDRVLLKSPPADVLQPNLQSSSSSSTEARAEGLTTSFAEGDGNTGAATTTTTAEGSSGTAAAATGTAASNDGGTPAAAGADTEKNGPEAAVVDSSGEPPKDPVVPPSVTLALPKKPGWWEKVMPRSPPAATGGGGDDTGATAAAGPTKGYRLVQGKQGDPLSPWQLEELKWTDAEASHPTVVPTWPADKASTTMRVLAKNPTVYPEPQNFLPPESGYNAEKGITVDFAGMQTKMLKGAGGMSCELMGSMDDAELRGLGTDTSSARHEQCWVKDQSFWVGKEPDVDKSYCVIREDMVDSVHQTVAKARSRLDALAPGGTRDTTGRAVCEITSVPLETDPQKQLKFEIAKLLDPETADQKEQDVRDEAQGWNSQWKDEEELAKLMHRCKTTCIKGPPAYYLKCQLNNGEEEGGTDPILDLRLKAGGAARGLLAAAAGAGADGGSGAGADGGGQVAGDGKGGAGGATPTGTTDAAGGSAGGAKAGTAAAGTTSALEVSVEKVAPRSITASALSESKSSSSLSSPHRDERPLMSGSSSNWPIHEKLERKARKSKTDFAEGDGDAPDAGASAAKVGTAAADQTTAATGDATGTGDTASANAAPGSKAMLKTAGAAGGTTPEPQPPFGRYKKVAAVGETPQYWALE
ncbi:unnamed protein product, partial [Amoebophrya sp. A120]|eukprot:GSA120T00001695001.1